MARPYREKLALDQNILWGDRYARTMGQALFSCGLHNTPTTFQAYIRKPPFGSSYLISAGQGIIQEWLQERWVFDEDTLDALREEVALNPKTGKLERLFSEDFLQMAQNTPLQLTIDAMPEGSLAFADEPIVRVSGPAWQALWVETAITNSINSQSLFATLASRAVIAAGGQPVVEYGLRRGHSIGGLAESRGAFIGGTAGTSNDQAWLNYHIPASGTMAHAFVMFFDQEEEAFANYLTAMPHNAVLLIDTYDTLRGVDNAISAAHKSGVPIKAVRLDSGDLAALSLGVRERLDAAGMQDTKIIASNNLDEDKVHAMKTEGTGCAIDLWALGTRLSTTDRDAGESQASLGAVYKLVSVGKGLNIESFNTLRRDLQQGLNPQDGARIAERIKLSQDSAKTTIQGELDIVRLQNEDGQTIASALVSALSPSPLDAQTGRLTKDLVLTNKANGEELGRFPKGTRAYRPLSPLMDFGRMAAAKGTIQIAQKRAIRELGSLSQQYKQLSRAPTFPVGIEAGHAKRRQTLMESLRA